jgi:ADP-ribosylglycohydrolase
MPSSDSHNEPWHSEFGTQMQRSQKKKRTARLARARALPIVQFGWMKQRPTQDKGMAAGQRLNDLKDGVYNQTHNPGANRHHSNGSIYRVFHDAWASMMMGTHCGL